LEVMEKRWEEEFLQMEKENYSRWDELTIE
jgi:hypothetical protein